MTGGPSEGELVELGADVVAALAAVEDDGLTGPIVLANGMWANRWHGAWRVTADRDGAEEVGPFVGQTLDDCRLWANHNRVIAEK
ncbi:hypothetical protein [Nocardia sp. AG03]|uniref:hypothetical protein n=1 Tax=Nocardia sp. AG03 TaxID=3025312 RepID=UPI002418B206|nr:hypothetical protein [Nocardia sp. AG03]